MFHVIKSAAHVPVAFFAALHEKDAKTPLGALREHVARSRASLEDETDLDDEIRSAIRDRAGWVAGVR